MRRSLNTKTFSLVHDYHRGSSGTSQSDLNYKKVFSHEIDMKAWMIIAIGSWACSASGAHSIRAHIAWSTIQPRLRLTTLGIYPAGILLPPSYHIYTGTLWHRTRGILPGILLGTVTSHIIPLQIKTFGKGHIAWYTTAPSLTEAYVALSWYGTGISAPVCIQLIYKAWKDSSKKLNLEINQRYGTFLGFEWHHLIYKIDLCNIKNQK